MLVSINVGCETSKDRTVTSFLNKSTAETEPDANVHEACLSTQAITEQSPQQSVVGKNTPRPEPHELTDKGKLLKGKEGSLGLRVQLVERPPECRHPAMSLPNWLDYVLPCVIPSGQVTCSETQCQSLQPLPGETQN